MGLLSWLKKDKGIGRRGIVTGPPPWMLDEFWAPQAASGERITENSALRVSAVYACVRVLSETVGSLPLHIYQRRIETLGSPKRVARDHPLYALLHDEPTPGVSSMIWREGMMGWLSLYGNAYALIHRDRARRIVRLQPWHPSAITVEKGNVGPVYTIRLTGGEKKLLGANEIFHLRALALDSNMLVGKAPLTYARETMGTALAQDKYGARFFRNNAFPSGVLKVDGAMEPEDRLALKRAWEQANQGQNGRGTVVFEDGVDFKALAIPNNDAQWLESRKFSVTEIARFFRVPPHLIGDLDRATFSNVEQMSLDFVIHTIRPYLVRWEQEINRVLFTPEERSQYFAEFNVEGLLRGDIVSRAQAYATALQNGYLSVNEVRDLENHNRIDGGDVHHIQLNMQPLNAPQPVTPHSDGDSGTRAALEVREQRAERGQERRRLRGAWLPVIREAAERLVRAEVRDIESGVLSDRAAVLDGGVLRSWLERYYADEYPALVRKILGPAFNSYRGEVSRAALAELAADADLDEVQIESLASAYVDAMAARHGYSGQGQIEQIVREEDDPAAAVRERLGEWEMTRGDKIARNETVRFGEAIAIGVFGLLGVTKYRWQTDGDACPLCNQLSGRVVGREESFLPKGATVDPEDGVTTPITVRSNIGHAPLHQGCNCMVVPE